MTDTFQPVATVTQQPWGAPGPKGRAQTFIQWKGTDVCLDFACRCGFGGHVHGDFAYTIQCPACESVWEMPSTLYLRECDGTEYDRTGLHRIAGEPNADSGGHD